MTRLSYKTLFIILLFLLIPIVFLIRINQKAGTISAAWWNDSWNYRVAVNIGNTSGSVLTNYQVSINIGTSALIATGKMKSDCSDIRVTDQSGKLLPYWFSGCNTANTQVWPKIPTIPTSGATVYIYYGNPSASPGKTKVGTSDYPGLSCKSILDAGDSTGIGTYWIDPTNGDTSDKFQAYCDMTNDNGGWMLVTQTMINTEVGGSVTTTKTTGANNGVTITNTINNTGCPGTNYYNVLLNDTIPWSQIKADYEFIGGNSCWSIFGNTGYNAGTNLIAFIGGTDTIRNQIKMGGSAGDNFDGINTRCDNETFNFWHSNQGVGTTRSAQVILRRNSMASLAGLGTGTACVAGNYPWKYQNIYIRETAMSFPTTSTPASEEAGGGPVAYWKFDEGVGTSIFDSTSNRNNGTVSGGIWQTEDQCVSGKCLRFNGTSGSITGGTSPTLDITDQVTTESWIYWYSHKDYGSFFGKPVTGSAVNANYMWFGYSTSITFWIADGTGYDNTSVTVASGYINTNMWHHIVGRLTSTKIEIWIDGVMRGQANRTKNPKANTNALQLINASYVPNAKFDEMKLYNYARTDAQIKQGYNAGLAGMGTAEGAKTNFGFKSPKWLGEGLIGHWKFDEGTGTTSADSSGNSNTATFGAGDSAPGWIGGKYGIGLSFGASQYATFGQTIPVFTNRSYSFWIFTSSSAPTSSIWNDLPILSTWSGASTSGNGYSVGINNNGQMEFNADENGNLGGQCSDSDFIRITSNVAVSNGAWHNIIVTTDTANNLIKIYQDGIQTVSGNFGNIQNACITYQSFNYLGKTTDWPTTFFTGVLDDLRVYNRVLSAAEVASLYNFAPGPVAYWDFEEGTGTTAYDTSGNQYNTVFAAGASAPVRVSGKFGKGLGFTRYNKYTSTATLTPNIVSKAITFSAWYKFDNLSGVQRLLTTNNEGYIQSGLSATTFFIHNINSAGTDYNIGNAALPTNCRTGWHYFTVIRDSTLASANVKVYCDGVQFTTGNYVNALNGIFTINTIYLGNSTADQSFDGSLDEVKIYNYARTQEQILQDMAGSAGTSPKLGGPIAYYKFDEGQGTTFNNSGIGGPGYNGVLGTSSTIPVWTNDGKFNKALSFGTNSVAQLSTYQSSLEYTGASGLTLSAWIKPDTNESDAGMIISKAWNGSGLYNYWLQYNSNQTINFRIGGTTTFDLTTTETVSKNQWHHIVATLDGSTQNTNIYIDGRLSKSGTNTVSNWSVSNGSVKLSIGCIYPYGSYCAAGTNTAFNGLIDEVKIYNYALSSDEVKTDYNSGVSTNIGQSNQTIGATSTSLDYCLPGSTDYCATPVAEWKFEEGTGTTTYDTSGNNLSGLLYNTTWSTGRVGKGLLFNGTTSYVDVGNDSLLNPTTKFSVEAWVKPSSIASSTNYNIFAKEDYGGKLGFRLILSGWSGVQNPNSLQLSVGNSTTLTYVAGSNLSLVNTWYHVAATYDNGAVKIYTNGILGGQSTTTVTSIVNSPAGATIGRYSTGGEYFPGSIDNVKFYNYARTPAQIAYDYNRGGPVGWWKLDECQGSTAFDSSGIGNTGSINIGASGTQNTLGTCSVGTSAAWTNGVSGKLNGSLNFDGTDDYVEVTDTPSFTSPNFSLSSWFKWDGNRFTGPNDWGALITKGNYNSGEFTILMNRDSANSTNQINFYINGAQRATFTPTLDTNWHHLTAVYNGSQAIIYLDGLQKNSSGYSSAITDTANNFRIGRQVNNSYDWGGQIDDVRIYNYALTATQVKTLYNGGAVNFR